MNDNHVRLNQVKALVEFSVPVHEAIVSLNKYPFDFSGDPFKITAAHICQAFDHFLAGTLKLQELRAWAEALEFRDDVKASGKTDQEELLIAQSLVWVANPELNGGTLTGTVRDLLGQFERMNVKPK